MVNAEKVGCLLLSLTDQGLIRSIEYWRMLPTSSQYFYTGPTREGFVEGRSHTCNWNIRTH